MATAKSKKKPVYTVTLETTNLKLARAFALLAERACEAQLDDEVTTFDAPLPTCGGPGDPC